MCVQSSQEGSSVRCIIRNQRAVSVPVPPSGEISMVLIKS